MPAYKQKQRQKKLKYKICCLKINKIRQKTYLIFCSKKY